MQYCFDDKKRQKRNVKFEFYVIIFDKNNLNRNKNS